MVYAKTGTPDANLVGPNFICDSLDNLQAEAAAILYAATVLISAVIGCWLDELVNDVPLWQTDTTQQNQQNQLTCQQPKSANLHSLGRKRSHYQ